MVLSYTGARLSEEGSRAHWAGSFLYYLMPYVEGESLRDKLVREAQLAIHDALRLSEQVASALEYAHRHGVSHRDVKPENILLLEGVSQILKKVNKANGTLAPLH